jgi:hypothetical protein
MRSTTSVLVLCLAGLSFPSGSLAQSTTKLHDEVEAQFDRLESKYVGNPTMLSSINRLRSRWKSYHDEQCYFEKTAAAGGEVFKHPPAVAAKAYRTCVERTTSEIKAALAKF